jgi:hypothetical protein
MLPRGVFFGGGKIQMIYHQINTISWWGILSTSLKMSMDINLSRKGVGKGLGIWKYIWPSLLIVLFYTPPTFALDVTLQWDANSETNIAGYKIYYDTDSGAPYKGTGALLGNSPIDVPIGQDENSDPNVVEFTLNNLSSGEYYFAVTAYTDDDPPIESGYSNETTGIQAGLFSDDSYVGVVDDNTGGGCFIDTASDGSLLGSAFYAKKNYRYLSLFIVLALIVALFVWRRALSTSCAAWET